MTPEDRLRMLIMGRDWGTSQSTSPSEYAELGRDPFATMPEDVRLPPMYAGGRAHAGLRPDTVMPETYYPEEMVDTVSFEPPSKAELIAAAHQKRRKMQGY